MIGPKRVFQLVSPLAAAICLGLLFPPAVIGGEDTVIDITQDYFVPIGAPPTARHTDYLEIDWLKWTREASVPDGWEAHKSVYFKRCKTPDVFEFCRRSKALEILQLNVDHSGKRCVLTQVDALPALRTLRLKIYMANCQLSDCKAIAQCKRLRCLSISGGVHLSVQDFVDISASKSLECIDIEVGDRCAPGALSALKASQTLKTIRLDYATAQTMKELAQIRSLENVLLGFDTNDATSKFSELENLPNLKYVSMCVKENDAQRKSLKALLPNVRVSLYNDPR